MLDWFHSLTAWQFVGVLSAANVAMYAASWLLVAGVQFAFADRNLNQEPVRVTRSDFALSLLIVAINIAVGLPGWWLWQAGWITLTHSGPLRCLLDLAGIVFFFDVAMYALHRVMHWGWLYRWFHGRHHDHVDVSGISFYVMNPLEAIGFGLLLVLFLTLYSMNFYALLWFLFFNWLYGTMGHCGVPVEHPALAWLVGDTEFHHKHHQQHRGNYGFYTGIWDRLFGTAI